MKYLLMIMSCLTWNIQAETVHTDLADIVAATGWNEEELLLGLNRLDNLYQNDMKTEEGRQRWHGPKAKTVIDADYGIEAITYADGETITITNKVRSAAQKVAAANAKLKKSGIPAVLARLRAKAAKDAATTNTVTITIGGK